MSTWPRKQAWPAILDRADKIGTERHGAGTFSAPFFFSGGTNSRATHDQKCKCKVRTNRGLGGCTRVFCGSWPPPRSLQ
ncbi:uncharacterized protein PgNI_01478 [Pyricularia grisea]|uniref:Uncharacterized protein n=1 Tax=Pyricularia grisea TaxID=148305 RepID=A0A6P8BGM5_PYRGI|nr:uncharacterized protein PgNI_01478 [Pyricularia grisea]TLD15865.1 hypothetical protein PgNI_01478 [Pyricularia grisea]